jgi:RHS repeat-associated protein
VATATYPNGLQSTFTYDTLNRLTAMNAGTAGYSYQLGATGNRTQATEQNGRTLNWSYDGIYRLTNEQIANDPQQNDGSVSYSLDPVGNRKSANSTLSAVKSGSFGYNADDEVSSETYDANGNTTYTGGKNFTYDSENHMTSMTANGTTVTMIYDAFGNRVGKTVNGVTTWYLVEDDVNPTGLPQVLEEKVGGTVQRVYTYGLQRMSQDQVVNGAWSVSFYGYDGAGSVRQLTNSAGAVTDEYEYDAYGNFFTKQGTTPNNYLYRGEQYDSDLSLYYLRARYYNPATGRFLSRDPENGFLSIPITLHKYLYAGGNPPNWSDPRGRDIVEYLMTLGARSVSTVEYLNTIGCYASILVTATTTILSEQFDYLTAAGIAGTIYGCVTTSWAPPGKIAKWVKTGMDVGVCLSGAASTIKDENDYLDKPTAANEAKFVTDDIGFVLGCALTGIGAALEP